MKKVGDTLERSQVVKKAAAITPHVVKLLDAAQAIQLGGDDSRAAARMDAKTPDYRRGAFTGAAGAAQ